MLLSPLHRHWHGLLLFVLCFVLYGNSIPNGYAVDDYLVTINPNVQNGINGIPGIFTSSYVQDDTGTYDYRPIVLLTYALEKELFDLNPAFSHFFNVLLYAFTVLFIFFFLKKLLRGFHPILPFAIALLYCVHPPSYRSGQ